MQSFKSLSCFSHSHLQRPFLYTLLSSLSTLIKTPGPLCADYLIKTFNFSQTTSNAWATRFSHIKSLERPKAVVQYLQSLGFSDEQIESTIRGAPQILIYDVNKSIKPKIEVFQKLGFDGSHLGKFFSKTSKILTCSLDRKLVPSIEFLKKILVVRDYNGEDLLKILSGNSWLISADLSSKLSRNVRFLENCGIVGDKLAMLLRLQPRLFTRQEVFIRNLVLKVTEMGFDMNSGMFVHALIAAHCISPEIFERKFEIFKSFGFSKDEYMIMVKRAPKLLNNSMKKSSIVLDFFLNTVKARKEELISKPVALMYSMEKRVFPRYKVFQIIKSKQLLDNKHNFLYLIHMPEAVFMEKVILKFPDHAEELLITFKGDKLDRSSQEKS